MPGEVGGVTAIWAAILLYAPHDDAARFGGPVEATLVYFFAALISVVLLNVKLLRNLRMVKLSDKLAEVRGELADLRGRVDELEKQVQALKGS